MRARHLWKEQVRSSSTQQRRFLGALASSSTHSSSAHSHHPYYRSPSHDAPFLSRARQSLMDQAATFNTTSFLIQYGRLFLFQVWLFRCLRSEMTGFQTASFISRVASSPPSRRIRSVEILVIFYSSAVIPLHNNQKNARSVHTRSLPSLLFSY